MAKSRELKTIFDSFNRLFDGRVVSFSTSYVQLADVYIRFKNEQLCHLLGLHKIYSGSASEIYARVMSGDITLAKVKRNKNYGQIKERIQNIDFLREGFIDSPFETCIFVSKTDNQNQMRLNLVFKGERKSRKLVLGLRKVGPDFFAPVTFFVTKNKTFDYQHSKRINIYDFNWIN